MTHIVDPQISMRLARVPQDVDPVLITAQPCFLQAIKLCVQLSGLTNDKAVAGRLGIEPAQWSKILSGSAHFPTNKYMDLMDECGNEVPLMWLIDKRGYQISSLQKKESEKDKLLREANERAAKAEEKLAVAMELLGGRRG